MFGGSGGDQPAFLNLIGGGSSMLPPISADDPAATEAASAKGRDERVLQWSYRETRDLIAVRGDFERDFNLTKRTKALWEAVAAKMQDRGYRRTPEQCKCKWKNLVHKYKGKEASEMECPFFEELHTVYTERAKNMHRLPLELEAGSMQANRGKGPSVDGSSDNISREGEDEDFSEGERLTRSGNPRKRKPDRERENPVTASDKSSKPPNTENADKNSVGGGSISGIKEMLQAFLQQQQVMEIQWRESMERCAQERLVLEQEWRESMVKLERERMMIEQAWRDREEQRSMREESRAERRDALLTTLLKKLIRDD